MITNGFIKSLFAKLLKRNQDKWGLKTCQNRFNRAQKFVFKIKIMLKIQKIE